MPTPQQVLPPLLAKLAAQQDVAKTFGAYYDGTHRLAVIDREYAETFGLLPGSRDLLALRPPDTNVSSVGVDALAERLSVESFVSTPSSGLLPSRRDEGSGSTARAADATRDTDAETAAARLFDECDLDVQQSVGHTEALIKARSFLLLSTGRRGSVLSLEDATQTAVLYDHEPPYDVLGAVKLFTDPWTAQQVGKLWVLPDVLPGNAIPRVQRYDLTLATSDALWSADASARGIIDGWQLSEPTTLPWTEVPVAEVAYRTRLLAEPRSYIDPIASLSDSYALLMAYLVISARYGAVPITTLAGVSLPRDKDGNVMPFGWDPRNPDAPPRRIGAQNALASEDPQAKFGRLDAGQLAGFIAAIDSILASITAITRIPQHYYGRGASSGISGETLKTSEAGMDRRVDDVARYFGQPWRRMVSLAVSADLNRPVRLTPKWKDTRTRIDAQLADALQKYVASGVDLRTSLEVLGFDPAIVREAMARQAQAQAQAALLLEGVSAVTGAGGSSADLLDGADTGGTPPGVPGAADTGTGTATAAVPTTAARAA